MASGEYRLPANSCDSHVHVYGPFDRFPAGQAGRFSAARETPVEALFALGDAMGIARRSTPCAAIRNGCAAWRWSTPTSAIAGSTS